MTATHVQQFGIRFFQLLRITCFAIAECCLACFGYVNFVRVVSFCGLLFFYRNLVGVFRDACFHCSCIN